MSWWSSNYFLIIYTFILIYNSLNTNFFHFRSITNFAYTGWIWTSTHITTLKKNKVLIFHSCTVFKMLKTEVNFNMTLKFWIPIWRQTSLLLYLINFAIFKLKFLLRSVVWLSGRNVPHRTMQMGIWRRTEIQSLGLL